MTSLLKVFTQQTFLEKSLNGLKKIVDGGKQPDNWRRVEEALSDTGLGSPSTPLTIGIASAYNNSLIGRLDCLILYLRLAHPNLNGCTADLLVPDVNDSVALLNYYNDAIERVVSYAAGGLTRDELESLPAPASDLFVALITIAKVLLAPLMHAGTHGWQDQWSIARVNRLNIVHRKSKSQKHGKRIRVRRLFTDDLLKSLDVYVFNRSNDSDVELNYGLLMVFLSLLSVEPFPKLTYTDTSESLFHYPSSIVDVSWAVKIGVLDRTQFLYDTIKLTRQKVRGGEMS